MKQILLLTGLLIFVAISCEKNDEFFYSQEDLNGTWESTEINSLGCIQQLEISSASLCEIKICAGVKMKFQAEDYSFDGRILKYKLYGLNMEFEISELTGQRLLLGHNDPIVYNRISR